MDRDERTLLQRLADAAVKAELMGILGTDSPGPAADQKAKDLGETGGERPPKKQTGRKK